MSVAGWGLHPLESVALSRRTPDPDIDHGALRARAQCASCPPRGRRPLLSPTQFKGTLARTERDVSAPRIGDSGGNLLRQQNKVTQAPEGQSGTPTPPDPTACHQEATMHSMPSGRAGRRFTTEPQRTRRVLHPCAGPHCMPSSSCPAWGFVVESGAASPRSRNRAMNPMSSGKRGMAPLDNHGWPPEPGVLYRSLQPLDSDPRPRTDLRGGSNMKTRNSRVSYSA